MLNILLIGNTGQLGWELERALAPLGSLTALDYPELDLSRPETFVGLARRLAPQVIVNAAAYTAVDRAESEAGLANAINAAAPGILAEEARRLGAALIHYSTDYVFDGAGRDPAAAATRSYVETDAPNPLGVYGQSKLDGERRVQASGAAALILRTSWVYSLRRDSFVTKVLGWARQQEILKVVDDQAANPTWARLLAEITALLLARAGADPAGWLSERAGLYHLAGRGRASRLEWAQAILEQDPRRSEQKVLQLLPAKTADFPTPATRPLFSALDCTRFETVFDLRLPEWRAAMALAMAG
jgi:dTDP-4-dehydrorhamnose reductase